VTSSDKLVLPDSLRKKSSISKKENLAQTPSCHTYLYCTLSYGLTNFPQCLVVF